MLYTLTWHVIYARHANEHGFILLHLHLKQAKVKQGEKLVAFGLQNFVHRKNSGYFSLFAFSLQQIKREQLSVTYSKGVVAPILFLCN
jgi:hypothetical protein